MAQSWTRLKCLSSSSSNYRVVIYFTCHFRSSSLFFILASSVCKSLQCLISALTQEGKSGHLFRLTCSVVLWGGRDTANKYHWHVWGVLVVYGPHWFAPVRSVCFPGLHCLGSRVLCRSSIQSGPCISALPRSKPLRFRFSGTPQVHRLSWACVLCPSQF